MEVPGWEGEGKPGLGRCAGERNWEKHPKSPKTGPPPGPSAQLHSKGFVLRTLGPVGKGGGTDGDPGVLTRGDRLEQ